jgi:hypothetical protein
MDDLNDAVKLAIESAGELQKSVALPIDSLRIVVPHQPIVRSVSSPGHGVLAHSR